VNKSSADSAAFPLPTVAVQALSAHPARSALLLACGALAIFAGLFGVMHQVGQFQKLDFRAVPVAEGLLVTHVAPRSGAARAGLSRGDLLLAVDGHPVSSLPQVEKALFSARVVSLTVGRGTAAVELAYYAPPAQVDVKYLLVAFAAMFSVLVATGVYLRQPSAHAARFFALTATLFPTVATVPAGEGMAQWLLFVRDLGRLLLPPLLVLFFGLFPVVVLGPTSRVLLFLPSLAVAAAKLALAVGWLPPVVGAVVLADFLDQLTAILVVVGLVVAALVALRVYSRARPDPTRRRQLEWVAAGAAAGFTPYLLLSLIPQLAGAELELLSWLSLLPLTLVPLGIASSLLEFRLWDLEDVLRQVIATGTAVLLGGVAFALFNLWLTQVGGLGPWRTVLAAGAGVALVGLAVPVRRALLEAVERLQYRERLAARQALATFAEQAVGISDPTALLARLGELLRQALGVEQVVLYRASGTRLVAAYPHESFPALTPEDLRGPFPGPREAALKAQGVWHRFVMARGERVLGIAYLGKKPGGMPLTHAERRLVTALSAQAALALENSLLLADLLHQVEQHRLLEEYLERIFASAAVALLICDASGQVLRANQRAAALFRGEGESLAGSRLSSLVELPAGWGELLPEKAAGVQVRLAGTPHRVGVLSVSTVELQPGQKDGRIVAVEDITQQLELEHRLAQQERMAALGRLAAGLAHEVNTPVTGIASYAQLLRELTPADDPRASLAEKIEEQAFRVARIVTNLLELARPAGFERQMVDLAAVAREEWLSLRGEAKRLGVACSCQVPDTLPIRANRVQLELVVHNLLRNALQATPPGGSVAVTVQEERGMAILEVRDTGPGIPEELRSRVFEPFVTTRAGQGGTGLGLAITRDIVRAHGGTIQALPNAPQGTVMRVTLPKEGAEHAHPHH